MLHSAPSKEGPVQLRASSVYQSVLSPRGPSGSRNALLTVAHGNRVPGMNIWPQAGPQWALLLYVVQGSSNRQTELGQSSKRDGISTQAQAHAPSYFRHWSLSYNLSAANPVCKQCGQAGLDATEMQQLSCFRTFDCPFPQPCHQKHSRDCLAVLLSPQHSKVLPPLHSVLPP